MSYKEYNDLYEKAKITGKYHMFIIDVVKSRRLGKIKRREVQHKLVNAFTNIYNDLKELEEKLGRPILRIINLEKYYPLNEEKIFNINPILKDPFYFGDLAGITIIRDSLPPKIVYNIINRNLEKVNFDVSVYMNDGYYDTDDYDLGDKKYYRGYCILKLEEESKKKDNYLVKKK